MSKNIFVNIDNDDDEEEEDDGCDFALLLVGWLVSSEASNEKKLLL